MAHGEPERGMEMVNLPSAWTQSSQCSGNITVLFLDHQGPVTRGLRSFAVFKVIGTISLLAEVT